jgi:hypothetical protein
MNIAQATTFNYIASVLSELPLFAGKRDAAVKLIRTPDTPLLPRFFSSGHFSSKIPGFPMIYQVEPFQEVEKLRRGLMALGGIEPHICQTATSSGNYLQQPRISVEHE